MTITEKILAMHSGRKKVVPNEFIEARVDIALGNDITAPLAIKEFRSLGIKKVFDKNKIVLVSDHFAPNKDIKSANQIQFVKTFVEEQGIKNYFQGGKMGVEHALLPEKGIVKPGDVVIGADSHTCTYGALGAFSTGVGSTDLAGVYALGKIWLKVPETIKFVFHSKAKKWVLGKDFILYVISLIGVDGALYSSMEFTGPAISRLGMSDRFSMCNMAIEAGGKNGIIAPDNITLRYLQEVSKMNNKKIEKIFLKSDKDAKYKKIIEIDASKIEPFVACPPLPSNGKPASKLKNVKIDQAFIGSCTNGRIQDLRIAAGILKNKKINSNVRLLVSPATQNTYLSAMKEGLIDIFVKAGGVVCAPSCGPCLGGHAGVLAEGEVCIATSNRNFIGRMGDLKSKVYLAGAAVVAASAIKGRIANPEEI